MSRLRGNPHKRTCGNWLGVDGDKQDRGLCGDPAVIRCNSCKGYFCEECWEDHLHMSVVAAQESQEAAKTCA
jgi:hypothetical protein